MAAQQESISGQSASSSSVSFTWATSGFAFATAGFAVLGHNQDPGAYTPPTGWVQIGTTVQSGSSGNIAYGSFWYNKNVADGIQSWSFANSVTENGVSAERWSGIDTTAPLEAGSTSNTGSSSTLSTGTINTANTTDVLIGGFVQSYFGFSSTLFSAPTNGFALDVQESQSTGNIIQTGMSSKIVSATQTGIGTGVTSGTTDNWIGFIAGFKQAPPGEKKVMRQIMSVRKDLTSLIE